MAHQNNLLAALLLTLLCCSVSGQNICPPAIDMAPCLCLEATKSIECIGMKFPFDIKAVFDRVGPLVGPDVVFDSLSITNTIITDLPALTVNSLKFLKITIGSNKDLETISPDAFNASTSTTTDIIISYNYLPPNTTNNERDVFDLVNRFPKLQNLQIRSQLRGIPDNALGFLPVLTKIDIVSNSITSIGSNAFAKLPSLSSISLEYNNLTSDGIDANAFDGLDKSVTVRLGDNRGINYLPEETFKTLLDNVKTVTVGGEHCNRNGCFTQYLNCDERADWICKNIVEYKSILSGFRCSGPTYGLVWDYCQLL